MKKLIIIPFIMSLSGCASISSGLLDKTMLCDVVSVKNGTNKGRIADSATIQDYPEMRYFVYNVNGMQQSLQSPVLVNGVGEYDGIEYSRNVDSYSVKNTITGNELIINRCKKAF